MSGRGLGIAVAAHVLWGLFVVYWKQVGDVVAVELIAHRVVWSFLLLAIYAAWRGGWSNLRRLWASPTNRRAAAAAAVLIGSNWLVFVWAVNADRVTEASLGYFIGPLVNVLLGVVILRERMRAAQWAAVVVAGVGVLWLTVLEGRLPWVSIYLALSFSVYGLIRKTANYESADGLTFETGVLFVPALGYIAWRAIDGQPTFASQGPGLALLVMAAGVVTVVPLVLYAAAARTAPLSLIGLVQYITPSLQFLLGVAVYDEEFSRGRFFGFLIIWIALLVFASDSFRNWRRSGPIAPRLRSAT